MTFPKTVCSQVVTPASKRMKLLKLSRSSLFTLDIDIVDWAQLTQKPSCRVRSGRHKHTQAVSALTSFVEAGRSEVNKDESITAGAARTEDSHHDEPMHRRIFGSVVLFVCLFF